MYMSRGAGIFDSWKCKTSSSEGEKPCSKTFYIIFHKSCRCSKQFNAVKLTFNAAKFNIQCSQV